MCQGSKLSLGGEPLVIYHLSPQGEPLKFLLLLTNLMTKWEAFYRLSLLSLNKSNSLTFNNKMLWFSKFFHKTLILQNVR